MNALLLIGRILFSLIFISSGISHLMKREAMVGYAKFKKVPAPTLMVPLTGIAILLGGLSVALGIYGDLGALALAIFLLPTAFMMHNFWKENSPEGKMNETIAFFKDLGLLGAALILFVLIGRHGNIGWHITAPFFHLK